MDDFEAVGTSELLKVKGGKTTLLRVGLGGDGGCAEGDPDPFGGTYSMGAVTVNGTYTGPGPGQIYAQCAACGTLQHESNSPRTWTTPLSRLGIAQTHVSGCRQWNNSNTNGPN